MSESSIKQAHQWNQSMSKGGPAIQPKIKKTSDIYKYIIIFDLQANDS
jgi:hypothetical protein